jgi:hypothetical protein
MLSAICPGAGFDRFDRTKVGKPRGGKATGLGVSFAPNVGCHHLGGRTATSPDSAVGRTNEFDAGPCRLRLMAGGRAMPATNRIDALATLPMSAGRGRPSGGPGRRKCAAAARPTMVWLTVWLIVWSALDSAVVTSFTRFWP